MGEIKNKDKFAFLINFAPKTLMSQMLWRAALFITVRREKMIELMVENSP